MRNLGLARCLMVVDPLDRETVLEMYEERDWDAVCRGIKEEGEIPFGR